MSAGSEQFEIGARVVVTPVYLERDGGWTPDDEPWTGEVMPPPSLGSEEYEGCMNIMRDKVPDVAFATIYPRMVPVVPLAQWVEGPVSNEWRLRGHILTLIESSASPEE